MNIFMNSVGPSAKQKRSSSMAVMSVGLLTALFGAGPAQAEAPVTPLATTSVKLAQSCTVGNFKGEMEVTTTFTPRGSGGDWTTTVNRYRITRLNGQSGGNKANVDLSFYVNRVGLGPLVRKDAYSPDAMIQDGQWHDLGLSGTIQDVPLLYSRSATSYDPLQSSVFVKFTFDKSGGDPSCMTARSSNWGREVGDIVKETSQVKFEDYITYCVAVTGGGTCTISKTETKSSSVTVGAGISIGWLTSQLSYSWVNEKSVTVSCTSPTLNAGQQFWAYPTGTRYKFSTFAQFFGQQALVVPGSAFEVDGGVACETVSPHAFEWN
ncbi:MAG TPA: hypothetical protein VFZ09_46490 [Archangium sp.]|uniref:hypothetical protein n=1 Tax=Archangium sp. TaxID=1872627 RepID=UPI002E37A27D|nr:hypothetical protein [Archangium sp.]HEX5753727.1 hypothetical protein [Archangium sp.]